MSFLLSYLVPWEESKYGSKYDEACKRSLITHVFCRYLLLLVLLVLVSTRNWRAEYISTYLGTTEQVRYLHLMYAIIGKSQGFIPSDLTSANFNKTESGYNLILILFQRQRPRIIVSPLSPLSPVSPPNITAYAVRDHFSIDVVY